MERAIGETNRRRELQMKYNENNNIVPTTIVKKVNDVIAAVQAEKTSKKALKRQPMEILKEIKKLTDEMNFEAQDLHFERAAEIRDDIKELERELARHCES